MKKTRWLLSFVLALTLLLSLATAFALTAGADEPLGDFLAPDEELKANYSFVAYASEQDYLADIEDGSFDGVADGNRVIVPSLSSSASQKEFVPPKQDSYIVLVKDSMAVLSAIELAGTQKLTVNLNGGTLVISNAVKVGPYSEIPISATLTFKNGNLDLAMKTASQLFTNRAGSTLNFENIVAKRNAGAGYTAFLQDTCGNVNFTNSELHESVNTFLLRPCVPGLNCTCEKDTCKIKRETYGGEIKSKYVFDGFKYYGGGGYLFVFNPAYHAEPAGDGSAYFANPDIIFKNSSAVKSDYWLLCRESAEQASHINIVIEEGMRVSDATKIPTSQGTHISVSFVDAEGEKMDSYIFGYSGNADFDEQLGTQTYDISWYNSDGTLIDTETYTNGATPTFASPEPLEKFKIEGDKALVNVHTGWALSKGGEEISLPNVSENASYYACFTSKPASIVVYDKEGEGRTILNAWLNPVIDLDAFSVMQGSYVKLFADSSVSGNGTLGAADVILDLSGFTLTLKSEDGEAANIAVPSAETFTVKNGTLFSNGAAIVKATAGSLDFYDTEFKSFGSAAIVLEGGSVNLYSCSVVVDELRSPAAAIVLGGKDSESKLGVYGTHITAANSKYDASAIHAVASPEGTSKVEIVFASFDDVLPSFTVGGELIKAFSDTTYSLSISCSVKDIDLSAAKSIISLDNAKGISATVLLDGENATAPYSDGVSYSSSVPGRFAVLPIDKSLPVTTSEANLSIYTNLSVWNGLTLNFLIPKDTDLKEMIVCGKSLFSALDTDSYDVQMYNGVPCYKISCDILTPERALSNIPIVCAIEIEGGDYSYTLNYSFVDYCEDIINGKYVDEAKRLAKDLLYYVRSSAVYFTPATASEDDLARIDDILDGYKPAELLQSEADVSPVSDDISSISYKLKDKLTVLIKLEDAAKAKAISIKTADAVLLNLSEGDEDGVIELEIPFCLAGELLTLTIGENEGTFDLLKYAELVDPEEDSALYDLISSLYSLGVSADVYAVRALGGKVGDTPDINIDIEME